MALPLPNLNLNSAATSAASGSIGNTIVYPPGVPGGDAFTAGTSDILRQVVVGVIVVVVVALLTKRAKG